VKLAVHADQVIRAPAQQASVPDPYAGATQLAIFDLDRTLVHGSSLVELASCLAAQGIVGRTTLARHALPRVVFARRGAGDATAVRVRQAALAALAGCEREALAAAARDAGQLVSRRLYRGARWVLDRHLGAGDFCVVVSAAPQELVEAVVSSIGAHRAVGTRAAVTDGRLTGELEGPFCYGPGKLARLSSEIGVVSLGGACAYSDSASDLPLLSACGHPVAVNPDRRLRKAAKAADWPILHFD